MTPKEKEGQRGVRICASVGVARGCTMCAGLREEGRSDVRSEEFVAFRAIFGICLQQITPPHDAVRAGFNI